MYQAAGPPVTTEGTLGHASARENHRHTIFPGHAQEIRPDFPLENHHDTRLQHPK
jgi:hypothetical protein